MKRRHSQSRFSLQDLNSPKAGGEGGDGKQKYFTPRVQIDAKSKNIIDGAQQKLQERLDSIAAKLERAKVMHSNDDESTNDDILKDFKLSGKVQFYDENWKETLEKAQSNTDFNEMLRSFITNFQELNAQKVDLTELPPKSDRQYVDSLIDMFQRNISDMYKKSVNQTYSQLKDQIQQAEFNLDVLAQQFEQSIDTLKKDLQRFKKQLTAQTDNQAKKEQKLKEIKLKYQHNQEMPQYFPLMVPLAEPKRSAIVRDKYRPKAQTALPTLPSIHTSLVSSKFAKDLPPPADEDGVETFYFEGYKDTNNFAMF